MMNDSKGNLWEIIEQVVKNNEALVVVFWAFNWIVNT